MVWWQVILFPFAILYDLITRFRNHLFNIGYTPAFEFEVNTLVVGNLSVGGTGKSPMVNYLVDQFGENIPMATLSRGYGRKSKGFLVVSDEMTPKTVGDEPYMFFQRYGKKVVVTVGEDRAFAIPSIIHEAPNTQVIILDDAYQHRTVKGGLNILLTRYDRPFYQDFLMPSGLLRESRQGARRADMIVVTKCPTLMEQADQDRIISRIRPYYDGQVYFTHVQYQDPIAFGHESSHSPKKFVVVTGIAHNQDFIDYCQGTFYVTEVLSFPDHHSYSTKDIRKIVTQLSSDVGLLTTEKDWVKLKDVKALQGFTCYFVPIAVSFLAGEELFLKQVKNSLKEYPQETSVQPQDH